MSWNELVNNSKEMVGNSILEPSDSFQISHFSLSTLFSLFFLVKRSNTIRNNKWALRLAGYMASAVKTSQGFFSSNNLYTTCGKVHRGLSRAALTMDA